MRTSRILPYLFCLTAFGQDASSDPKFIPAAGSPKVVNEEGETNYLIEGFTVAPGGTEVHGLPRDHGVTILLEKGDYEPLVFALKEFFNQPLNNPNVGKIKSTIVDYFRKEKGIYVAVIFPAQEVKNGNIIVEILEGQVSQIEYKGQKWFSEKVLKNKLNIQVGEPLQESKFLNDLTWLNRNPFLQTQMVLIPGKEKGVTDLLFVTKDRFPVRFFVGSDNTGYQANGQFRLYGGFNWGNAFQIGDILSYQYTADPNFHSFQSHVVNYTHQFSFKQLLSLFGCYGSVYPNVSNFTSNGINVQFSGRYMIPILPLYGLFRSRVTLGFDYKYLTSNLFFTGDTAQAAPPSNNRMALFQLLFNYHLERNWTRNFLTFTLDMIGSPVQNCLPFQTPKDYTLLRNGSHVQYAYWKMALSNQYQTKAGWTLNCLARGQLATCTLPTSEQFGLGGADTVRGYYEQQFVADDAFCGNLEFYTPSVALFKSVPNHLSFLAFMDYGYGYNYSVVSEEFREQTLLGMGAGMRYDIVPYLIAKFDYGFQIFAIPQDNRTGRYHFSLNVSY